MDKEVEHIQTIVDIIALKAIALPLGARPAFIEGEIAKVRDTFRQTYKTDPKLAADAMKLVDQIDQWTRKRVQILEIGGGRTGTA
jgi:hypothetical protein